MRNALISFLFVVFFVVLTTAITIPVSILFVHTSFPFHESLQTVLSILYRLLSYVVYFCSLFISAWLISKLFKEIDAFKIAKYAVILYAGLDLIFLLRDILVRDYHGVPITRHYFATIQSDVIGAFIFYLLSLIILNYYQKKKK